MLLRVPERLEDELERQDEFECLNLTITVPGEGKGDKMPILVWVHGMYAIFFMIVGEPVEMKLPGMKTDCAAEQEDHRP